MKKTASRPGTAFNNSRGRGSGGIGRGRGVNNGLPALGEGLEKHLLNAQGVKSTVMNGSGSVSILNNSLGKEKVSVVIS